MPSHEQLGVRCAWRVGGLRPRLAVQRHDEVVAGSGAGDVEQPDALVVAHLLVDRLPLLELVGADVLAEAGSRRRRRREHHLGRRRPAPRAGRHARHDRDRELEALGRVDGHDAHGVVVGLGQHRLGDPGALGRLQLDPAQVLAQAPAGRLAPARGPGRSRSAAGATRRAGRPSAKPSSNARRSRAMRSSSSDGAAQCRCVVQRAEVVEPAPHRVVGGNGVGLVGVGSSSGRRRSTLKRNRSSSPQPSSGERSAVTMRSWSVGSSTARSTISRSRTARVRVDERARLGPVRDPRSSSASSRNGSDVRAGSRIVMSPSRAGRQPPSSSSTDQPSSTIAPDDAAATSAASARAQRRRRRCRPACALAADDGDRRPDRRSADAAARARRTRAGTRSAATSASARRSARRTSR